MDPNSETESEPSVDVCEAARIAYVTKNGTQVLCPNGCRESARQEPVVMLVEDTAVSDVRGAPGRRYTYVDGLPFPREYLRGPSCSKEVRAS